MSYAQYLRDLLRPLGVYDLSAPFNGGELEAAGRVLDGVDERLEEIWREASLCTAESWGLERIAQLLTRRPAAETPRALGDALAALLRIGGDSFTLEAINDTVAGCGVAAQAVEAGAGAVTIAFPGVAGVPAGFEQMSKIIEDILPPHLEIRYYFWYLTWEVLEQKFSRWKDLEAEELTWEKLEVMVTSA